MRVRQCFLEVRAGKRAHSVNPFLSGSDTVMCEGTAMMTTLTVLATLVVVPLLFGVLLAIALAGVLMALIFAPNWVRGLRSGSSTLRVIAA
jgi:hypothetical protein